MKHVLTVVEAGEIVGRSDRQLREEIQAGRLKAIGGGKGRPIRISRIELARWFEREGGGQLYALPFDEDTDDDDR